MSEEKKNAAGVVGVKTPQTVSNKTPPLVRWLKAHGLEIFYAGFIVGGVIFVTILALNAGGVSRASVNTFFANPYLPDTSVLHFIMVIKAGLAGFALGWFFSEEGKQVQLILALVAFGLWCFAVVIDNGSIGWGLASFMAIAAFVAALVTAAHRKAMGQEAGQRHLGRVRDHLLLDGEDMRKLFHRMLQSQYKIVRSTAARCLQKEEKLLSNVLASVQAQTHFLDSASLRESLSASDFDFADLKTKPMTIYLVLPSDRLNAFAPWLRLLTQQSLTVNACNIEKKPEKPVLFILDEMAALGKLSMVEQAFGLMAGYGIQLWAIVQDLSQMKRIYGDGWETFIANAGIACSQTRF